MGKLGDAGAGDLRSVMHQRLSGHVHPAAALTVRRCGDPIATTNYGSRIATNAVVVPAPVANTTYCLPMCMKVIGTAVIRDGISTAPT